MNAEEIRQPALAQRLGYGFIDEEENDRFSFPLDITRVQQYKQFGNSVTIPVIEEMAQFMLRCFDKMNAYTDELVINLAAHKEYITK